MNFLPKPEIIGPFVNNGCRCVGTLNFSYNGIKYKTFMHVSCAKKFPADRILDENYWKQNLLAFGMRTPPNRADVKEANFNPPCLSFSTQEKYCMDNNSSYVEVVEVVKLDGTSNNSCVVPMTANMKSDLWLSLVHNMAKDFGYDGMYLQDEGAKRWKVGNSSKFVLFSFLTLLDKGTFVYGGSKGFTEAVYLDRSVPYRCDFKEYIDPLVKANMKEMQAFHKVLISDVRGLLKGHDLDSKSFRDNEKDLAVINDMFRNAQEIGFLSKNILFVRPGGPTGQPFRVVKIDDYQTEDVQNLKAVYDYVAAKFKNKEEITLTFDKNVDKSSKFPLITNMTFALDFCCRENNIVGTDSVQKLYKEVLSKFVFNEQEELARINSKLKAEGENVLEVLTDIQKNLLYRNNDLGITLINEMFDTINLYDLVAAQNLCEGGHKTGFPRGRNMILTKGRAGRPVYFKKPLKDLPYIPSLDIMSCELFPSVGKETTREGVRDLHLVDDTNVPANFPPECKHLLKWTNKDLTDPRFGNSGVINPGS